MYRFGIFGKDARMKYLCLALKRDGYPAEMFENQDLQQFIDKNDIIVLPVSRDYDEILKLCRGKTVMGGFIGNVNEIDGVKIINYAVSDYFRIRNALPSAEGALQIAMAQTDYTVCDCNATILGYGNIGKCLTDMLLCLGTSVTVVARKESDRAQAENYGAAACDFSVLPRLKSDIIFNTVPAPVISRQVLDELAPETLVIDLASEPGGTDFDYASKLGITVVHALGIPGKFAPRTAGEILKSTILSMLTEV